MTLGERLKSLRLKMKKTLKDQSESLGVSINSIYRWEHDLTAPRKAMLKKIADFYGVSLEWMFLENSEEEARQSTSALHPEDDVERQLLWMYRKLSESKKYKILGYVERVCVEDMDQSAFAIV